MGQKTHPIGFRLGISKGWYSYWFDEKNFAETLQQDIMLRKYVQQRLGRAAVSKITLQRTSKLVSVDISTARPGIVIGRKGEEVDQLREELKNITGKDVQINVVEIKRPELDAHLVADNIVRQVEGKVSFRRAIKKAIMSTMRLGSGGIRICASGRLGGAEMSRTENYQEGRVPLHTLRADIDFASVTARTAAGAVGIKVWIYNGEVAL